MTRIVTCELESLSPYVGNRPILTKRMKGENNDDFENRIWLDRLNYNSEGKIIVPALMVKHALMLAEKSLRDISVSVGSRANYRNFFKNKVYPVGDLIIKPNGGIRKIVIS